MQVLETSIYFNPRLFVCLTNFLDFFRCSYFVSKKNGQKLKQETWNENIKEKKEQKGNRTATEPISHQLHEKYRINY